MYGAGIRGGWKNYRFPIIVFVLFLQFDIIHTMTAQDAAKFWIEGADDAMATAQALMDAKRYHHALFFCHLAIEKALKAKIVVATNEPPLPIHDLLRLAEISKLVTTTGEQLVWLREIDKFNIAARYDDYKRRFYKQATVTFATLWFGRVKELLIWLNKN